MAIILWQHGSGTAEPTTMAVDASADVTTEYLRGKSHADLLETADEHGDRYVEGFLTDALPVEASFLADPGQELVDLPAVTFDPHIRAGNSDP